MGCNGRSWLPMVMMIAALGCGSRTGLRVDADGGEGEPDAGLAGPPMRWVLADLHYQTSETPVGLLELSAEGELRYEERIRLGQWERIVGVSAEHVFVDSYLEDRQPPQQLRILSTRDLSDVGAIDMPGDLHGFPDRWVSVDCVLPLGDGRAVAFGSGIYFVDAGSLSLVEEVDTSGVRDFWQCRGCARVGDVAGTMVGLDQLNSELLLLDLSSRTVIDSDSTSAEIDCIEPQMLVYAQYFPSPRLRADGRHIYLVRRHTSGDPAVERFDPDRMVTDGVVLSSPPLFHAFLWPDPIIYPDGRWLTGHEGNLVWVDSESWSTEPVPGAWVDGLRFQGALAEAWEGRHIYVGTIAATTADSAIALRDNATGIVLTALPLPNPGDGRQNRLWAIRDPEEGAD